MGISPNGSGDKPGRRGADMDHQLGDNFRLIDIQSMRLVLAPSDCTYVALSYQWGDTPMPRTTTLNKNTASTTSAEGSNSKHNSARRGVNADIVTHFSLLITIMIGLFIAIREFFN